MTAEGIQVVHALPGRVRLKVAGVKGNPGLAGKVRKKLAAVPGIRQVEANPVTGNVLIHYDHAAIQTAEALEPLAAILGEFCPEVEALSLLGQLASLTENLSSGANPGGGLITGMKALNAEVGRITGGLDLKLLAPLTLFFFGVRSLLAAGKTTVPAWHDYFWFAFSSLVMLNRGWFEGSQAETAPISVTQGAKEEDLKEAATAG
jgi:hypothetical protein